MNIGRAKSILVPALLFLLALLTLLSVAPHLQPLPLTDSSVFLYIGERVREGAVPYRDAWDHKGPLIYYIQAIGLSLVDGSRWGVWIVEVLFVFGAAWAGYAFMRSIFGGWPALFGSVAFLLQLPAVLDGGNLVEEYGLLFQFLFLFSLTRGLKTEKESNFWLAGVWSACLFLLRPNLIALPVAAGVYLGGWFYRTRQANQARQLKALIGGGGLTLLAVVVYFALNQALPQMLDAVIRFNFMYSDSSVLEQAYSARVGLNSITTLGILGVAGWWLAMNALREFDAASALKPVLAILATALPLEVAMVALSGRAYPHYYMSLLVVAASLAAFLVYRAGLATSSPTDKVGYPASHRVLVLSLLFGYMLYFFWDYQRPLRLTADEVAIAGFPRVIYAGSSTVPTLEFFQKNLPADTEVLVWGNYLRLNWLSGRNSPTRFVYQTPLFTPGYASPEMVQDFIMDLQAHPDAILIDTTSENSPHLSIGAHILDAPEVLRPLYAYIKSHYQPAVKMERTNWQVYFPIDF